jgi:hypothetical protein
MRHHILSLPLIFQINTAQYGILNNYYFTPPHPHHLMTCTIFGNNNTIELATGELCMNKNFATNAFIKIRNQ